MTLSEELQWRGFVNQTTLSDISELDKRKFKLYFGVDPSADSMTVGNLAAAMMVKAFMKHGHDVTLLVGGATGLIGDPSFKEAERSMLTLEEVENNKKAIAAQYDQIFGKGYWLVDNYDWFKDMGYLEFLRDVGKHFSLTPLLQRDYIASRIGEGGNGMSYAEFSYTLIQGYDFYYLNKEYGIDLQVCGSDQWGNSISGVELIRRKSGREAHIYSVPLVINKATGKKFGKSEDGAVWLDPAKTSVYKFYQFWLNADDEGTADYLKIFTELDRPTIEQVMAGFEQDRAGRLAQKTLAYEVTRLIHGADRADSVKRVTETLFGGGDYTGLSKADFKLLDHELPTVRAKTGAPLIELLVESGLAGSNSEARRFLAERAVYINGRQLDESVQELTEADIINGHAILRRGKNTQALIVIK